MNNNNINGTAECPQTKGLQPIEGQRTATDGVKKGNYAGKNGQPEGGNSAAANIEWVKKGNYERDADKRSLPTRTNYEQGVLPQEWLYNPVVYSQVSGDFSLLQQRILGGVLSQLQDRILYTINEKEQNKQFPSLFADDDTEAVIELDIDPHTLGITPDHYGDLDEALWGLSKLTMGFPKYDKGKVNYVIAPLFARFEMPRGETRRTGRVHVYILRKNAEDFFSLTHGYTVHLARITQLTKKKRTPRIYIFLSSFRDIGHKEIEYTVFCKFLGIDEDTARADLVIRLDELVKLHEQEERDRVPTEDRRGITRQERNRRLEKWENPFRKYTKVRSQILEPTKQELDSFMQCGEIDFSFSYEPLYKTTKQRGNPSHIRFSIIKGSLALERDGLMMRRRRTFKFITAMTRWCPDLKSPHLQALCDQLPDVMLQDFTDYGYRDVRQQTEQAQPDDVAAYALKLMRNWIAANLPAYQQHWRDIWQRCQQDLLRQATREESRTVINDIRFETFSDVDKTLILQVPSREAYEYLEQPAIVRQVLTPTLVRHFGRGLQLKYRKLNK